MHGSSEEQRPPGESASNTGPEVEAAGREPAGGGARSRERAAAGPSPEPVSAAENPAPVAAADSPAAAQGRRILSTGFVRVGPDGHLTVTLRNARVLVLRDVVMRRKDYCGAYVLGGKAGARYCGEYSEIAAAKPGGALAPAEHNLAVPNRIETPGASANRN